MAEGKLRIEGKNYDLEELTLDEVEQIEEALDAGIGEIDLRRAKVIKVIVYTLMRRDNPALTLEEVGQIKMVSLAEDIPTNGASET